MDLVSAEGRSQAVESVHTALVSARLTIPLRF